MVWEGYEDAEEISIKDEIRALIARHGREAYLRKRTDQKCRCMDPITEEADVDCPTCSGLGYVYLDHKIKFYKHIITRAVAGAYRKDVAPFGVVATDEAVMYIEAPGLNPSVHDWLVEVRTDELGKVDYPAKIERAYDVNDVVDYRENYGQIAYWALRTRSVALGK